MFDISEKLIVGQSDEIFLSVSNQLGRFFMETIICLVDDEEVISLSHAKVYVFSDSVLCLGKVNQNPTSNTACEQQLDWFKDSSQDRALDKIDGEPMEFEWNIFPGFTTLLLVQEVQKFMTKMGDPSQFKGRINFMLMFNDIIWRSEDIERECIANDTFVTLLFAKKISSRTLVISWTWIRMQSAEIIYQKEYVSPRPPPTISFKDNWMKELDSEVAGSSKDTQRKTQLSRTVRPVGEQQFTQEIEKDVLFGREGTKHSTRTGRPVGGQQSTQLKDIDVDFRVPGLSHAVVKEAENFRVQELVKKIESHPHREALQPDLQQNNVYNLFSNNSKAMIRELGNVDRVIRVVRNNTESAMFSMSSL